MLWHTNRISGRPLYEYDTLSILDFTDEELKESNNPFALVILAAKTSLLEGKVPDLELLERKVLIANILLAKGIPERKIRAIFVFLENNVRFADPEMNSNFRAGIQSQDKNNVMGIDEYLKQVGKEEGLEEGRKEEQEKSVRIFLTNTEFSVDKIASLVGVSIPYVEKIKKELQSK